MPDSPLKNFTLLTFWVNASDVVPYSILTKGDMVEILGEGKYEILNHHLSCNRLYSRTLVELLSKLTVHDHE